LFVISSRYLQWSHVASGARCEWCQYQCQTRDHLLKGCPEWRTAEDNVGNGKEGNDQAEEPMKNPGPPRRPTLQPGDPRFPGLDTGGTESAKAGRRRGGRPERGVRVGTEGARGKGRGKEAERGGNGRGWFSFLYLSLVRRRATRKLGTRCESVSLSFFL